MRISDWSSDVCSSDLRAQRRRGAAGARAGPPRGHDRGEAGVSGRKPSRIVLAVALFALSALYAAWFHDDRHRLAALLVFALPPLLALAGVLRGGTVAATSAFWAGVLALDRKRVV